MGINNSFSKSEKANSIYAQARNQNRYSPIAERILAGMIFILVEVMIFHLCLDLFGGYINTSTEPGQVRSSLEFFKLIAIIVLRYANVMLTFYRLRAKQPQRNND